MPFENDGVISWELMVERYNAMLANILGNLVKRTISMTNKYFGGVVTNAGAAEEVDEDLKNTILNAVKTTSEGPVIFKQERIGLGGKPFMMYKFRTMTVPKANVNYHWRFSARKLYAGDCRIHSEAG